MGRRKSPYRGILKTPITFGVGPPAKFAFPFVVSRAERDDRQRAYDDDLQRRVAALFEHYGIAQDGADAWKLLAMGLAQQHVPGFQTQLPKGAPTERTLEAYCVFYRHFIRVSAALRRSWTAPAKITDVRVLKDLRADARFKVDFPNLAGGKVKTMENWLSVATKLRKTEILRQIRRWAFARDLPKGDLYKYGGPIDTDIVPPLYPNGDIVPPVDTDTKNVDPGWYYENSAFYRAYGKFPPD